jgi:hypothetical protein
LATSFTLLSFFILAKPVPICESDYDLPISASVQLFAYYFELPSINEKAFVYFLKFTLLAEPSFPSNLA